MEKNFNHFLVDRSSRYLKGTAFKELYVLEFFTDDMNTEEVCLHVLDESWEYKMSVPGCFLPLNQQVVGLCVQHR